MIRVMCSASALALALVASSAGAETIEEAAAVFGAREQVQYVSLSPSGVRVAYIAPDIGHGEQVFVVDLAGDTTPKRIFANADPRADIASCDWATEQRLVCSVSLITEQVGQLLGYSRLIAIGADGSDMDILSQSAGIDSLGYGQDGGSILALDVDGRADAILMTREYVPEGRTAQSLVREKEGLSVVEVDIGSQKTRLVEQADRQASRYVADEKGRVRLMVRRPDDGRGQMGAKQFYRYRTRDSDRWLDLSDPSLGTGSLTDFYPVAVDSARDVAYGFAEKGGYDALYAVSLDGSGRVEEMLAQSDVDVDQLIRVGRSNRVVGASYATEKRTISYIDADFAALAVKLGQALPGKPLIDIVDASQDESKLLIVASSDTDPGRTFLLDRSTNKLGELLPLRSGMADRAMGAMRPVTFPAADGTQIPAYLTLPHGKSDAKGLPAVVLPHGGPSARDEWGFDWLVQFFADPARIGVVGWSYGGYAALQSQVLDPALYKAVVAIAPVTDLDRLREESRGYTNYPLVDRYIGRGDHVAAGSPARNAARFAAPVPMFHGTLDQNVGVDQSRRMKSQLESAGKSVAYTEFPELAHSLSDSRARTRMLIETGRFLEQALKR